MAEQEATSEVAEQEVPTTTVKVAGRDWIVPEAARDDFELLNDMGRLDEGNLSAFPRVLSRLLDRGQQAEAMDALRDPATGRVTIEKGIEFVSELLAALNPN